MPGVCQYPAPADSVCVSVSWPKKKAQSQITNEPFWQLDAEVLHTERVTQLIKFPQCTFLKNVV